MFIVCCSYSYILNDFTFHFLKSVRIYENNSAKHKNIIFLFVDRTICISLNAIHKKYERDIESWCIFEDKL